MSHKVEIKILKYTHNLLNIQAKTREMSLQDYVSLLVQRDHEDIFRQNRKSSLFPDGDSEVFPYRKSP